MSASSPANALSGVVPVDVAQRDDVLGREVDRLVRPCPPTPTAATFRRSLGAVKPAAEHVARHNRKARGGGGDVAHEPAPGNFGHPMSPIVLTTSQPR